MRRVAALLSLTSMVTSIAMVGACADGHAEGSPPPFDDAVGPQDETSIVDARVVDDVASDASVPFEDATKLPKRRGIVRLDGRSLKDDGGTFVALGATLFWATWAYKFDRPRLDAALSTLSKNGFHYLRALGTVGDYGSADFWDGREIDWRWTDYPEVIAGLTDLAFDVYGLRVEWTLIGDGQKNIPNESDRRAHIDRFIAMSKGREQKIIHFEIANEAWQNGFSGDSGLAQLRAFASEMKSKTDLLVAASAPDGQSCSDWLRMYGGGVADLATLHFDRDLSTVEGGWRPVRLPWEVGNCAGMPVASNNEPIGPGASVSSENDPTKLLAAAITSYVAQVPLYVFHSKAGVRGDDALSTMPGIDVFTHLEALIPGDLPSWERKNMQWADAPFVFFAGDESGALQADKTWPEVSKATSGVVRAYGAVKGNELFVFPIGIKTKVVVAPRKKCEFDVIDPKTGKVLAHHVGEVGAKIEVSGAEALILRGVYL